MRNDEPLTFAQLVMLYGPDMAYDLLVIIEKMAQIDPALSAGGVETRLSRALAVIAREELEDQIKDIERTVVAGRA